MSYFVQISRSAEGRSTKNEDNSIVFFFHILFTLNEFNVTLQLVIFSLTSLSYFTIRLWHWIARKTNISNSPNLSNGLFQCIQHLLVVSKEQEFAVIFQQIHHVLFDRWCFTAARLVEIFEEGTSSFWTLKCNNSSSVKRYSSHPFFRKMTNKHFLVNFS